MTDFDRALPDCDGSTEVEYAPYVPARGFGPTYFLPPYISDRINEFYSNCANPKCRHSYNDHSRVSGKCWKAGCRCGEWQIEGKDKERGPVDEVSTPLDGPRMKDWD